MGGGLGQWGRETSPGVSLSWGGEGRGGLSEILQRGQRLPVGGWGVSRLGPGLEEQQQNKGVEVTTGGLHLQDTARSLG